MDSASRRGAIAALLAEASTPVSASALADHFSVSRQLIVGDIALLRAGGTEITATPRGYLLPHNPVGLCHIVACSHTLEDMGRELELMVDYGCHVEDVIVEHPVYGQLVGQLHLSNRYEVAQFLEKVTTYNAKPLSHLTGGIHLHTLRCPSAKAYQLTLSALGDAGFLVKE